MQRTKTIMYGNHVRIVMERPVLRQSPASCLVLLLSLGAATVQAEAPRVGYVKTFQADAVLIGEGITTPVAVGSPVRLGDRLRTSKTGSLGVTFQDDTIMSIGPDTELVVDEYLYDPGKDSLKIAASLLRGTLNYVSGVIAKLRPEAVSIKTPTGTIGVRGTHFAAKVVAP